MSTLGSLARFLFRCASRVNTANIVLSGNPRRIGTHIIRKKAFKRASRVGRYYR